MIRSYRELILLNSFEDRFKYLKMDGRIGDATFGYERCLNQSFYGSKEWRAFRRQIIIRDGGCDMGLPGCEIFGRIEIHHINPITIRDIEDHSGCLMDPDNVVCVSSETHKAIHYAKDICNKNVLAVRTPNDTSPWLVQN